MLCQILNVVTDVDVQTGEHTRIVRLVTETGFNFEAVVTDMTADHILCGGQEEAEPVKEETPKVQPAFGAPPVAPDNTPPAWREEFHTTAPLGGTPYTEEEQKRISAADPVKTTFFSTPIPLQHGPSVIDEDGVGQG